MYFQDDKTKTYDLICMGRVGVDLYAQQVGSRLKDVQSFNKYLGGSPGNISVGTARLGLKSALFSGVGSDALGQFLKQQLTKENVNTDMVFESPTHLTALAVLGVQPPSTFPLIFYRENCADMQLKPMHVNEDFIARSKAFQFSGTGISTESMRDTTRHALDLCKKYNTKVILDVDYRPVLWGLTSIGDGQTRFKQNVQVTQHYQAFLPYCDLIVGTDEELCIAAGVNDPHQAIKVIHQYTKADIVYKTGLQGSEVHRYAIDEVIQVPAFVVNVFNTLGAGDAYMSGLLAGLLSGKNWQMSLTYANACGALVCARHGCAPAIPNMKELEYFIQGYKKQGKTILQDKHLAYLHQQVNLGQAKDYPLALLAYDHRWQFEKTCDEYGRDYQMITDYKNLVYQAFNKIFNENKDDELKQKLGIICDPQYGEEVLQNAITDNAFSLVPIEASNIDLVEWITDDSAYAILNSRPASWGVKVLWKYHVGQDQATRKYQLNKLKELAKACESLERRLMLELIIPHGYKIDGKSIADAIDSVYAHDVYPFWWKLQMVTSVDDWQQIDAMIDKYDDSARIIVLGGGQKPLENYRRDFALAKRSRFVNGFAFGRSIFWQSWLLYCQQKITDKEVITQIANRYKEVLAMWNAPSTELKQEIGEDVCHN
ncbi:5-dehydro-2-deoxygluconokinase [Facilibium subflavum]|uniref:5-dehydro-2-deoxygluconokinase n=1 Tax=Facilibium subflavum TaxID=2219058 RepID=UPI000E65E4A2|nr:5-dehydro-2-deoxygluconokinase [Facilibium subflavum]